MQDLAKIFNLGVIEGLRGRGGVCTYFIAIVPFVWNPLKTRPDWRGVCVCDGGEGGGGVHVEIHVVTKLRGMFIDCPFQITPSRMTVREDGPGMPIAASTAFPIDGAGIDSTVNKDLVLFVRRGGEYPDDIVVSRDVISIKENQLSSDEVIVTAVRDFVNDKSKKVEVSFSLVDDHPARSNFWEGYQIQVQPVSPCY